MILQQLRPTVLILRWFGFWTYRRCRKPVFSRYFYSIYTLVLIVINISLFLFNAYGIKDFTETFGFVNVRTTTFIINGLKPLHAALNLSSFFVNKKLHEDLIKLLINIDDHFRATFDFQLNVKSSHFQIITFASLCFVLPFGLRLSEYILLEQFGTMWFVDLSLLLVPLLSMWQMLPLYYYYLTNSYLHTWFRQLNICLAKERSFSVRSIGDYAQTYIMLTKAVYTLGTFFNSFVFCSMGISLSILCITIYYITNAHEALQLPSDASYAQTVSTYYFPAWTALQIIAAVMYLTIFCVYGWRTNEGARKISPLLLSMTPSTIEAKYQVDQVMHKIYTQFNWGISIWRIVLFERSLLLTMISAIITYAMVLVKLQPTPCDCNTIGFTNVTSTISN